MRDTGYATDAAPERAAAVPKTLDERQRDAETPTTEATQSNARSQRERPARGGRGAGDDAKAMPHNQLPSQSEPEVSHAAPVAARATTEPSAGRATLPKVEDFELPKADLAAMAEASGLQWVNSDAGRIAQVQAAIDAESEPMHVPRQRPEVASVDDSHLVLVETRRDMADMRLPFEARQKPHQHPGAS